MITEKQLPLPLLEGVAEKPELDAASHRWMVDLGISVERLARMMRTPTEIRPFVYEVRFDLLPVKARNQMCILKGFGAEGPLVAFYNMEGFLGLLRGVSSQMNVGKLEWYPDKWKSDSYGERAKRYASGEFYRV